MKPQISASDYEKTVKFIVKYTGAGDQTPRENIQTAKWERSLKITKEGKLTNTDWQSDKEKFNDVVVIKVERINYKSEMTKEQQNHKIENSMNDYHDYDYVLINDTLEKLQEDVIEVLKKEGISNEKND